MGTYFFHEETLPESADGAKDVIRYYYDDISEDILIRSFRFFSKTIRKEFLGTHRFPLADLRADVKAALHDFLFQRMQAERRRQAL